MASRRNLSSRAGSDLAPAPFPPTPPAVAHSATSPALKDSQRLSSLPTPSKESSSKAAHRSRRYTPSMELGSTTPPPCPAPPPAKSCALAKNITKSSGVSSELRKKSRAPQSSSASSGWDMRASLRPRFRSSNDEPWWWIGVDRLETPWTRKSQSPSTASVGSGSPRESAAACPLGKLPMISSHFSHISPALKSSSTAKCCTHRAFWWQYTRAKAHKAHPCGSIETESSWFFGPRPRPRS